MSMLSVALGSETAAFNCSGGRKRERECTRVGLYIQAPQLLHTVQVSFHHARSVVFGQADQSGCIIRDSLDGQIFCFYSS